MGRNPKTISLYTTEVTLQTTRLPHTIQVQHCGRTDPELLNAAVLKKMSESAVDTKTLCLFDVDGTLTAARQVIKTDKRKGDKQSLG